MSLSSSKSTLKLFSSLISDGMVLQQGDPVQLWGSAKPKERIVITASWYTDSITTSVDGSGGWKITLRSPEAGGPYSLTIIEGLECIKFQDILCGEVWLAAGQSNMEMPLDGELWDNPIDDINQHLSDADCPEVRMFMMDKQQSHHPKDEVSGTWLSASPETVREFSAVGYFFARKLLKSLDVPIGIINASMSATAIESWSSAESLQRLGVSYAYEASDDLEPAFPGALYNGMIYPIRKYPIAGVIWYQGESNIAWATQYQSQLPDLISQWRFLWKKDQLPFYFVQIAPYEYEQPLEAAELRDAQLQTFKAVSATGMVVSLDVGDPEDVHPTNKLTIGERLALWAIAKTYDAQNVVYSGPVLKDIEKNGSILKLNFESWSIGSGLELKSIESISFEVQDEKGQWLPVEVEISDLCLLVNTESLSQAKRIRYAWRNAPEACLFNREGLPASPFIETIP